MEATDFVQKLRSMNSRIANMDHREALEAVAPEVHRSVAGNYSRQTDEDGIVWPPRKDNLPHDLLILTTAMLDASTGGAGAIVQIEDSQLRMGIEKGVVPYYWVHHVGAGNVPKRRYYYLHPDDRERVLEVFGVATKQAFRKQVLA